MASRRGLFSFLRLILHVFKPLLCNSDGCLLAEGQGGGLIWGVTAFELAEPYATLVKDNKIDIDSIGRGERTRTFDLMLPKHARYQLRHTPLNLPIIRGYRPFFNITLALQ